MTTVWEHRSLCDEGVVCELHRGEGAAPTRKPRWVKALGGFFGLFSTCVTIIE